MRRVLIFFAAPALVVTTGFFALKHVHTKHAKDYCFKTRQVTPDKDTFKSALESVFDHNRFDVENLRELLVTNEQKTSQSDTLGQDGVHLSAAYMADRKNFTLDDRIYKLAENEEFLARCCKRVRWDDTSSEQVPSFWDVFWGVSPRAVQIRFQSVVVEPSSLSPKPTWLETGNGWFSDVDQLKIEGPILKSEWRNVFVSVDVCGELVNFGE